MTEDRKVTKSNQPDMAADGVCSKQVRVEMSVLPVVNYAMQHNGTGVIRSVSVENLTETAIENAELTITSSPAFAVPFTRHMDYLPAGKTVGISDPQLIPDGEFLAGMTEKVSGLLHIELKSGEKTFVSEQIPITVLAFDEWQGIGLYPELLCSFVTPNHPKLARIIARAAEFMGEWTGDTSLDGYQSQDPNRVLNQAAAVFTAIKEQAIVYAVPPASFENAGQRVRMCDAVLQQKLGTCLDLTLLYASCLEALGLHPLLIVAESHIFIGIWLENSMFPECVQDDFSLITKRLASGVNEIAVVETTVVTTGRDRSFDDARDLGEQNLNNMQIECIIDVHRARMSRITPLPQRVAGETGWEIVHDASFREENLSAPARLDETVYVDVPAEEGSLPRKVQWERKLLDLGMRNTLINLRMTKTQLPILANSPDELENALADGSDFSILPRPAEWKAEEFSFEALNELGDSQLVRAEFENKRLRSVLTEGELAKALKGLYRSAKTSLEENGTNTLYLALGMLRWFESKRSTKARYAPIILLPVEMVRKSAAHSYVIRLLDDEPQMNITLLEKLKQDFDITVSGLDPLPADEHGIDIRRVFTVLRKAVMEQPRWDVLETADIGIFSFSQFVMWNDLRSRTDDLVRSKVVASLMEGKLCWDAEPLEMGEKVNENDVLLPMPADASQLYAIQAACGGESFVLHGPPGTGKSQTITSMIANALAQGKSVLFVAEKMAALEVVQKRLENIGIGPFCLELHSNKSRKKDVLEQLRRASEVTRGKTAAEYAEKAKQLSKMRAELDGYARMLHRELKCGSSLYTLINEYEYYREASDMDAFERSFIKSLTGPVLENLQLTAERMVAAGKETGHPCGNPLADVACTCYTQNLRNSFPGVTEAYRQQLEAVRGSARQLAEALGEKQPENYEDLQKLSKTAAYMTCWYDMPSAWTKTAFPQLYFEEVMQLAQHSVRAEYLEKQLLGTFDAGFLTKDGAAMFAEFTEISGKWFLPKLLGMKKLTGSLNAYARVPVEKESIRSHIINLRDYQQERKAVDQLFEKYGQDLGMFYQGKATDWNRIAQLAQLARTCAQGLYGLYGSCQVMNTLCGAMHLREAVAVLSDGFAAFAKAKDDFDSLLCVIQKTEENWMEGQIRLCETVTVHADRLKEWIAYVGAASEAKAMGLGNLVSSYEKGADHEEVLLSYRKALLQGLICDAIDESGELNQFSGAVFNQKIEQYKRMDQEWAALSQREVYCRLAAKVPDFTREAANSSELGILQRCIRSGGRGTSIRRLFEQIPNLLPRLCPCMLMSPISAAQYLDPGREPFDIVIFDEASQLPTCKAVGVLARGKDAVIVGDPKQMPPTSFFASNTVDEDNLETEDLESILDDCLALNMPQSHLLWHYRSRHESLIAFSNSQFYENKLYTFPSVNDRESKVRLVKVDGTFDRGRSRTNRAEAEAVTEEIIRRSKDPELRSQSIGVVTFNISQQHLIDDLITEACAKDPELEKWAFVREEPLFVKNLENVQGDERDVILFSVGFGPDENGRISMNFGPLNREGGWRRLNVAVTRARCEMTVFSAMNSEQLNLNRTGAEGVIALRNFLKYAEGSAIALQERDTGLCPEENYGVAEAICEALEKEGYHTDLSVGRSEYRIDIGVIDPQNPDRYLLGIMLDGSSYGTARTTRDREIAQIGVLTGLGWNLLRVWCMDWWDNSEKERKRILEHLKKIQEESAKEPAPEAAAAEVSAKILSEIPLESSSEISEEPQPEPADTPPVYEAAVLPLKSVSADDFTDSRYESGIRKAIVAVVDREAPVSLSLLTRRVVQSYGITRAGSRIQNHINRILQKLPLLTTVQEDTVIYWKPDQNPQDYPLFRVNGDGDSHRDIRDIPVQEIANALCTILHEQISMPREDLLRETAVRLGYSRLGNNVTAALELGIRYALEQKAITIGSTGTYILTR